MVESRKKTFVTSGHLIPVYEICNSIADGMDIHTLSRKYGISTIEIYDAIDFYSEYTEIPLEEDGLVLDGSVDGRKDEITLEILSIHETVLLKCLSISRYFYPEIEDFSAGLYNGIRIITIDNLINKMNNRAFKSALHMLVQNALDKVLPKDVTDQEFLDDLDADEYLRRKNIF